MFFRAALYLAPNMATGARAGSPRAAHITCVRRKLAPLREGAPGLVYALLLAIDSEGIQEKTRQVEEEQRERPDRSIDLAVA
jgi:hypothetical protein